MEIKMSAIKYKTRVDLLDGPIFPSMIRFAIPILFSNLFQQMYNTMDTVIVGHTLGETSLAAIGSATAIYDLLIGFALGIGRGLSIVTARSYGSKDRELLKRSVASSIVIGIGITVILTLLTRWILFPFLQILHTPEEIINEAYSYIATITLFTGVMFAYNLCSGLLTAIGNSVMPLVFLVVSSVLNVFLDLLFITQMHMGVRGAAIATVIAQSVSVFLCILYILKKAQLLVPTRKHFCMEKNLYQEMIAQGLSMAFMNSFVSAGTAILQLGINGLGYLVIAGHTAARKLFQFGMMPFSAMNMAVNTFTSQNAGANRPDRIRKAMKCAYTYSGCVTVVITVFWLCCAPAMVKLVSGSNEPVVLQNGAMYLRVVAPAYFILGFVNSTRNALQAIGKKLLPILSSIIELIGKILFVMIFIPHFGYMAVIFCEPVIWFFMAVELVIAFWTNPYIKSGKTEVMKAF